MEQNLQHIGRAGHHLAAHFCRLHRWTLCLWRLGRAALIGMAVTACTMTVSARAELPLQTEAERSGFKLTGRYEEVERLCGEFERHYPGQVRCLKFGETPEGRPMMALSASQDGVLTAEAARTRNRPVVFFEGGIHAGEIDGKDAGFWALRDWLEARDSPLSKVTVLFVPVFNVDGHERFGAYNRPNQVGPEQMGWRTTAQNLNLNRDWMKAEAPEMQAMLTLLREWDPIVLADLHVTDGGQFQHVISINVLPGEISKDAALAPAWATSITEASRNLEHDLARGLAEDGHLPLTFYPSFIKDDAPESGFRKSISTPRYSHAYWSLHNRIGILVETHSWKNYATRVRATHDLLVRLVALAAKDGAIWLSAAAEADTGAAREAPGMNIALTYTNGDRARQIDFLGYAYRKEHSDISEQMRIVYDTTKKETWKVPFFDEVKPGLQTRFPAGGYIVPPAHAGWMSRKLAQHGVKFHVVDKEQAAVAVEAYRAVDVKLEPASFEGRQMLKVEGSWKREEHVIARGSLFIPTAQPRALLIAHLFEPNAPDSVLAWGFFNSAFEAKEYMENYVLEDIAREFLKDPAIKANFEEKLRTEVAFAQSPKARLEFFYRLHQSWDAQLNLYPVFRIETPLE
jgi:Zinc carboxypeptidase